MIVVSLFLILNFSIGVSASSSYDGQEADACITISQRLSVRGGSTSNDVLDWSITKRRTGETRYEHVKLHEVNDLSKESHGVFYGDSVNTINKAWSNKSNGFKISGERVDTYIIPYENAGYAGGYGGQRQNLNTITIITQKDSNKIITGFPGNGYKYSLDGIIGGD